MEARLLQPRLGLAPGKRWRNRKRKGKDQRSPFGHAAQFLKDRLRGVALDHAAAAFAIKDRDLGEEELQMIVQLGHRADRRARGLDRSALVDRDRRRNAFDALHVGLVHAVEELARVRGETLHVAPLSLGVKDVEGESRFARAADAGNDGERVQRNIEVEVFEIVLLRAADADPTFIHGMAYCS